MMRHKTREIRIGDAVIGGGNPILIQSMTNTRTADADATIRQIHALEEAGCEIVRCAVPSPEDAEALSKIRRAIHIPLVADIHFDWKLAVASIRNGADKVRINPGNIGGRDEVSAVVEAAKQRGIPIRVGVNSGSLRKDIVKKYGGVTAEGLAESALGEVAAVESLGYENIVISIKTTDVPECIEAHRILAEQTDYPVHIGITEAGIPEDGIVKSAVGIGILLYQGIGDTVRVSLTGDPVEEVLCAKRILRTLGLRKQGVEVIACPTCGRTRIDLIGLAKKVTDAVRDIDRPLKVAVMGCVVNGPGEAKEADFGIAGGIGEGLLFRKGEIIAKLPEDELVPALMQLIRSGQP
ncbi:MAG: flavodoxin-dependent (E)-4-hydroxy-3-methylbut-2-enyl-diphosphate synthase [Lachnospiraceae bacterium]|nr:flavodoxin-dependent (E)-4-hydroxy-3-methylbut-2-enyl-diphosphate synthase [Lachnospiraceae bacterium]